MKKRHLNKFLHNVIRYGKRVLSLDTKALSVFRIAIALLIIVDICLRLYSFDAFVSAGIFPLDLVREHHYDQTFWSIHTIRSSVWWLLFLHVVHIIAALLLLVGYKTRYAIVAVRFMTASMHGLNPMILNGGDNALRVLLFWAMFLPLGDYWSFDRVSLNKIGIPDQTTRYFGIASIAFIAQIIYIYVFSFLLKTDASWHTTLNATYLALSLDGFRTSFGDRLYHQETILQYITWGTMLLEGYACLFLFSPWKHNTLRGGTVILFCLFHIGLLCTLRLGLFPWIMIASWSALLPLRDILGEKDSMIYNKPAPTHTQVLLFLVLLYITARNIRTLDFNRHEKRFPYEINRLGFMLRMEQHRSMFAPHPTIDDGWFEIAGTHNDGKKIQLNDPRIGLHYKAPKDMIWDNQKRYYTNEKWHKWYSNMRLKSGSYLREPFLAWVCKQYDVDRVDMFFITENTKENYTVGAPEHVHLARMACQQ